MGGNNYLFTMAGFRLGHCWDYNAPSVPFEPGLSGACSCAQAASGCRPRSSLSLHCALCRFSHRPHLPPSLRRGRRGLQAPDPTGSIWKVPWAKRGHTGPPWARRLLFPLALALSCGPWFTLRTLAVCQALSCLKVGAGFCPPAWSPLTLQLVWVTPWPAVTPVTGAAHSPGAPLPCTPECCSWWAAGILTADGRGRLNSWNALWLWGSPHLFFPPPALTEPRGCFPLRRRLTHPCRLAGRGRRAGRSTRPHAPSQLELFKT